MAKPSGRTRKYRDDKPRAVMRAQAGGLSDASSRASEGGVTRGLSPLVLTRAWMDWAVHLAASPGKQMQLLQQAMDNAQAVFAAGLGETLSDADGAADPRFDSAEWQKFPFNLLAQAHQRQRQWWLDAMTGVRGVDPAHENLMAFVTGLLSDAVAPSNFPAINPDVISTSLSENGLNLVRGSRNFAKDMATLSGLVPAVSQPFEVGRNLATTAGKVVFRNKLMELIQYAPTTDTVRPEPILIVPAWILKYYVLDLSPHNSFVRFLVDQGFTVFMISWKNPLPEDRDIGMEDYRQLGVMAAINAAIKITGAPRLHTLGYCLGGTLLSIAAAAMGRDGDDRLASVSLLATQVDFSEAGPLRLLINEAEVAMVEEMMERQGYLSSDSMAGAFALLRARDLIWTRAINNYLLGRQDDGLDLMAWHADATRLPARMHSQYLRQLFLNNDLAQGRYLVKGKPVGFAAIRAPIFAVGTEEDDVAPWTSVYRLHLFTRSEVTFVLTNGGHNTGIISAPGQPEQHFRIGRGSADSGYREPEEWLAEHEAEDGSWWVAFARWLGEHSGEAVSPPQMGARSGACKAICDAPGTYVMQR